MTQVNRRIPDLKRIKIKITHALCTRFVGIFYKLSKMEAEVEMLWGLSTYIPIRELRPDNRS